MKLNYFESALQCKFKIRVLTCFYSPGLVPHSPKSKERVRVQKVGPGEVSPSIPDHGMSNSPQRNQGYVYILNQGFYFILCSRIILALRLTIVHVERNLCINFSNSLRSQFFSTVFL